MSLVVKNLLKQYGSQKAVDNISFRVEAGEIVGFLGPNGAGKSTTMKIATGYVPPTSGEVLVAGFNVTADPIRVKKVTGYLPEHNPLYTDMFVHEYLQFIGKLYGLGGKSLNERVAEMVDLCGLTVEQNKKIETLSKGYRQRVGLAQALIHNPQVLILDEPTTGLDPNQILEIRSLIKNISKNKTVIFSTHIMQEVSALCDRVIVINKGELVADDSLSNLMRTQGKQASLIAEFEGAVSESELKKIEGVENVIKLDESKFRIYPKAGADVRPEVFRFAADRKLSLLGLRQEEGSLENIFRELTAKQEA
ncbi:MAG TPA: gliding motility-associated ABC transporter ATP-binding subunit GldA [Cyclobacteriaceae bacterium]|nr:gliding motility-associated ABC transporter ATP-binding subunit GldA [Cyclobacteriaceae bacterium]HMV08828.1 gliding motility-associated ABC transporter ATP-binding subunit GldA [Cyclobacteriaceae bacterium]HMV90762.1 gliding motility-associated ABC transporter ATP-binding subunit GldA [Cyclobacteriaceae bacterium]HMW99974.1 gliding motility-associated ABC transporter ATP-binding subunit GldA [Cyclobacteriaceae bacterium]HMX49163.1 gliding motility-associated ABC transporter ATP-binding subu